MPCSARRRKEDNKMRPSMFNSVPDECSLAAHWACAGRAGHRAARWGRRGRRAAAQWAFLSHGEISSSGACGKARRSGCHLGRHRPAAIATAAAASCILTFLRWWKLGGSLMHLERPLARHAWPPSSAAPSERPIMARPTSTFSRRCTLHFDIS